MGLLWCGNRERVDQEEGRDMPRDPLETIQPGKPKERNWKELLAEHLGPKALGLGLDPTPLGTVLVTKPLQRLPNTLRKFLAETPEGSWKDTIKNTWEWLGEGLTRQAYRKDNLVAKVPIESKDLKPQASTRDNLMELMYLLSNPQRGSSRIVLPKPYAFSTQEKIPLMQYLPLKEHARGMTKEAAQQTKDLNFMSPLVNDFARINKFGDIGMEDFSKGGIGPPHNWGLLASRKPNMYPRGPMAGIYDLAEGSQRNVPAPQALWDTLKENPMLKFWLEKGTYNTSPAIDKLLKALK